MRQILSSIALTIVFLGSGTYEKMSATNISYKYQKKTQFNWVDDQDVTWSSSIHKKCNSYFSMKQPLWTLTKIIQKIINIHDTN